MPIEASDPQLSRFRRSTICPLLAVYGMPILVDQLLGPDWLFVLAIFASAAIAILIIMQTWDRLGEIGWWRGILLLVLVTPNIGPTFYKAAHGGGRFVLDLGSVIGLLPLIICWLVPTPAKRAELVSQG